MRKQRHIIIIFLTVLIASCAKNGDPVKVLKDHVVQDIKNSYGDKFKLASFEKINAKNGEVFGIQVTEIEYKAIFKNPKKLLNYISYYDEKTDTDDWQPEDYLLTNSMHGSHYTDTITIHKQLKASGFIVGSIKPSDDKMVFRPIDADNVFEVTGEKVLHKTENGWIIGKP